MVRCESAAAWSVGNKVPAAPQGSAALLGPHEPRGVEPVETFGLGQVAREGAEVAFGRDAWGAGGAPGAGGGGVWPRGGAKRWRPPPPATGQRSAGGSAAAASPPPPAPPWDPGNAMMPPPLPRRSVPVGRVVASSAAA